MKACYTRLYADDSGESHFEELEVKLPLTEFAPAAPRLGVSQYLEAARTAFVGGPTGWAGDWHVSSARNLFVVISGEWEIEASDGTTRRFTPTDVLLAEDTRGKGHKSRVIGEKDSIALLVQLSD